jgi:hypothetical protein
MRNCPACQQDFSRCKTVAGKKVCPRCGVYLHYQRKQTILLADKLAVDGALSIINDWIGCDLGEATPRERLFLYRILEYIKGWLGDNTFDVGKSPQDFLVAFFEWIIAESAFWRRAIRNAQTTIVMKNWWSRLIDKFFALLVEEVSFFDDRDEALEKKLQELKQALEEIKAGDKLAI